MPPSETRPRLSVVLATYGRPDTLPRALGSLAAQTLDPADFEVVVVVNGEPLGVTEAVEEFRTAHPAVHVRLLESLRPGVAHARSLGVEAARGTYMTMVDDDDWVSPTYLQRLLEGTSPGTVPLVAISDVLDSGEVVPDADNIYSVAFGEHRGDRVPGADLPKALSLNVCKLLPNDTARASGFETGLRSASDTLFWLGAYARVPFGVHVAETDDAVYYRSTGDGSLSRQKVSHDFSVVRRMEGLEALERIDDSSPEVRACLERTATSLGSHVHRYLVAEPEARPAVTEELAARGLREVPWPAINAWRAADPAYVEEVLLAESFAGSDVPTPAERAFLARAEPVDVLATTPPTGDRVPTVAHLLAPWVSAPLITTGRRHRPGTPAQATWTSPESLRVSEVWTKRRGVPYPRVRSWSASGLEHVMAAAYSLRYPGTTWIAERTPGVGVAPVTFPVARPLRRVVDELVEKVGDRYGDPREVGWDTWVERLLDLADEVLSPTDLDRRATGLDPQVSHGLAVEPVTADPGRLRVLLVDDDRGEGDLRPVLDVLQGLPGEDRARVHLHLSTRMTRHRRPELYAAGVGDIVSCGQRLPWIEELARARTFDALVLLGTTDPAALATARWRWLDLTALGVPVWALTRPGDPLSQLRPTVRSSPGDVDAGRTALHELLLVRRPR